MQSKILIIDDEYLIRISLREGLTDLGYLTQEAETIELRLKEVMKSDQYHLISDVTKRINKDLAGIIDAVSFAR